MWPIRSSKEEIVWSCGSKNNLSNVSWKFWSKLKACGDVKSKKGTPADFTILTIRSSQQRCCIRKQFLKILQDPLETPVWESILKNFADLSTCNFIKKRLQHKCFPVNVAKFLIQPILKNICKRLLFKFFFNSSFLHGTKGSRSRLHDGIRLQGLVTDLVFVLSRHISPWNKSQPAFENLRQIIPLVS